MMGSPYKDYAKQIYDRFRYYPTWLPGVPLRLGDVGTMEKGVLFRPEDNLDNLGIKIQTREDSTADSLSYTSERGVEFDFKAQGETPKAGSSLPQGNAGISISFTSAGALIFKLVGCKFTSITNTYEVSRQIRERNDRRAWDRNWMVITQLCAADTSTILMSYTSEAKVEVSFGATITSPTEDDLVNVKAGMTWKKKSSMATDYLASSGLTPLFRLSKLYDREYEKVIPVFAAVRGLRPQERSAAEAGEVALVPAEPGYDTFEEQ